MAALTPDKQVQLDRRDGTIAIITEVTLASASDTVTLPVGANTTDNLSCKQVHDANETAATVTFDSSTGVATIVGNAGDKVTLMSLHRFVNSGSEPGA